MQKLITFYLEQEILKDFKVYLLKNDSTMKDFFNGVVKRFIELEKEKEIKELVKNHKLK